MNLLVTLSGEPYDEPTRLIVERAPEMGKCYVLVLDDVWWRDHPFWNIKGNQWLQEHPVSRGLWWYSFKVPAILYALQLSQSGDVVMWNDADSVPIKPFHHLFDQCRDEDGVLLFRASGHNNRQWCKRDAFVAMCQDQPKYWNMQAGVARFAFFQKGSWKAQQFLAEWMTYTVNAHCNTFDDSCIMPELEGFKEHRCEQAIMTLLAGKYGIPLHPELDYDAGLFDQQNPRPAETRQQTAPIRGSKFRNV